VRPCHRHRDRWPSLCLWTLLTILLPAGIPAQAEPLNRPFWAEQAMFRFGEELFFVGQASCAKSTEEGRQKAFAQGVQELLNYAQASSPAGVEIATQMVFEESSPSGCPSGTVTVWRLLRVDAEKVAKVTKTARYGFRPDVSHPPISPRELTPHIGMSQHDILARFGRPWSISIISSGGEIKWEYPTSGLTLSLDQDNFLTGWRLATPQDHESNANRIAGEPNLNMDLTGRLRDLERAPQTQSNVVYNQSNFPPSASTASTLPAPQTQAKLSSQPFTPTTLAVSGLAVPDIPSRLHASGMVLLRCDFAIYGLSLWHVADGTGPQISLDLALNSSTDAAIRTAIKAAAKAVGYDPRFLGVRLSIRLPHGFRPLFPYNMSLDASEAGAIFAVTVASAILGDPVRADVTMVGKIDQNFELGPVEELEEKLNACHQPAPLELILPAEQNVSELAVQKIGVGIKLARVNTLAEAYEVATGQPLRLAQ